MTPTSPAVDAVTEQAARRAAAFRPLWLRPLPATALAIIVLVVAAVVGAPLLAPHPPLEQDLTHALTGPGAHHLLGTDALGRDLLSRLLWGGRPALLGVAVGVLAFALVGLTLGVLGGYLGGWVDRAIVATLDVMLSVPGVILMLAVLAIFHQSIVFSMAVLGFFAAASLARIMRSACISLRAELFVDAARVSGLSPSRIMVRHIVPGLVGPLLVQLSLFAGIALSVQTGLGFLGLGTQAPHPSWGGMVGEASTVIEQDPYFLFVTGGVIALLAVCFGLVGDGLRDVEADRRGGGGGQRPAPASTESADLAGSPEPGAVLTVRDLSVAFGTSGGPRTVVDGVDFVVRPGEILGLVGESGSGKTVTALSVLGLLPDNGAVVRGGAWIGDVRVTGADEHTLRGVRGHRIGLISQEPMVALDPYFTIGSQLSEVVRNIGAVNGDRGAAWSRAVELLASVHLREPAAVMRQYPHELSGGMLQRVVIAMALAGSPDLLIADEPTTALDVTVQAGILDLLKSLRDTHGMAIILVTHDLAVVADICDRAIVMQHGRIVEEAAIDDLFYSPAAEYTRKLLASTPNIARHDG